MDRQQQGNLLIGSGVLVGLGTIAYWLMSGGWEQMTSAPESAPLADRWAEMMRQKSVAQQQQIREKLRSVAEQAKAADPYKAARDRWVASTAVYTPSLYE